jgi:hypothetical protein
MIWRCRLRFWQWLKRLLFREPVQPAVIARCEREARRRQRMSRAAVMHNVKIMALTRQNTRRSEAVRGIVERR